MSGAIEFVDTINAIKEIINVLESSLAGVKKKCIIITFQDWCCILKKKISD